MNELQCITIKPFVLQSFRVEKSYDKLSSQNIHHTQQSCIYLLCTHYKPNIRFHTFYNSNQVFISFSI